MGGPEVMEYGEVPDPIAAPDQVIVDIHAASVNAADAKVRHRMRSTLCSPIARKKARSSSVSKEATPLFLAAAAKKLCI